MGSRFVQVTFRFRDEVSRGMQSAAKNLGGLSDKVQVQYKDIGKLGKEWTKCGKSMQKTGASLTKNVTVPVLAAGTAASKLYTDFDKSMAQVNTLLDDDSHLNGYKDAVLKVSDELGIKATTVSEGLYQTISVLGDHGETTEKTFRIMAQSAKAGRADVTDAVNMIATAMNGYGQVSDETAQKISDLSFKTVKLGKTTFPELANSMSPLFPLANNLGISYEELYATMSTATTSFAGNTAEASTQIKGLMTGFLKPTKDMQALIEKAGYSSGAAMVKSEGLAGALKLVQAEAGDDGMSKYFSNVRGLTAALGLSGSGMDKFEKHLKEMQNASGATGEALAKMGDTDAAKWNKALIKAQNAGIKFGQAVLPAITPLVEKFGEKISQLSDWFSNLSEGQQQMIIKMLAGAAAAGPLLTLLGKGTSGVGSLLGMVSKFGKAMDGGKTALQALTTVMPVGGRLLTVFVKGFGLLGKVAKSGISIAVTAFKGLGSVLGSIGSFMLANPILIVIAAIAAGAILIWKNWDKVKGHLEPVFKLFKDIKKELGDFKKAAQDKLNAAKEKFGELKDKAGDLKAGVASRFESMKEQVSSFRSRVGEAMSNAGHRLSDFVATCSSSTSGVTGYLGGLINFVRGTFTGNWRTAWNGVKQAFQTAWNNMKSAASSALSGISSLVSGIVSKVTSLISKIGSAKSAASGIKVPGGTIPEHAKGTAFFQGGWTKVHEKGGEILNLPRGTQIIPHDVSMHMAETAGKRAADGGVRNVSIAKLADQIIVREDADIDKIATALVEKLEMIQGDVVYA